MEGESPMVVGGVQDWFKGKIKSILLSYAKPYWDEISAAIQNKDYAKLADVVENIAKLAGYVPLGLAVGKVLRDVAAKDWFTAAKDAVSAVEMIVALFPKPTPSTAPDGSPGIHLPVMGTGPDAEIDHLVDAMFAPSVVGDSPGSPPEVKGVVEICAVISAVIAFASFIRQRRQKQ